jgi:hypothetical protein
MMTKQLPKIFLFSLLLISPFFVKAQLAPRLSKGGLYTYLQPDSSTYLRVNMTMQTWARFNQNNPGSTLTGTGFPANGEVQKTTTDVGIRRIRLLLSGQISPRVFFFVQFGQNSWNYLSARKAGAFFHDVTGEYAVVKKKLTIGFGLNGWNGPGRFANSSVSSILGLDPPLFQEVTNDINDQFVRHLGVYFKGKLGGFDYRLAIDKPLALQQASTAPLALGSKVSASNPSVGSAGVQGTEYTYAYNSTGVATQGYFMWQFLDKESNLLSSTAGSYLGTKRIFNIGVGFKYQNKAMWSKQTTGDTTYHSMALFAVDVFYDAPLSSKGNALTLYGGYFNYNYGKGYLRLENPMNTTNGLRSPLSTLNGTGNGYPGIGTGNILYGQVGYKMKNGLLGEAGTLQFYAESQYAKFDALNDPMFLIDAGVNWLIHGNNSKFTLNWQSRPVYSWQTEKVMSRKNGIVLQYQVAF